MQTSFLKTFFKKLNNTDIRYCVWGNHEFLPENLNGSDLDIIIKMEDKYDFQNLIRDTINKFNGKIISFYNTPNQEHYSILGKYRGQWWGIFIDVIFNTVTYRGQIYIPEKYVWLYTIEYKSIKVNDLGFSYLAGFLKELLHTGKPKDKYLLNSVKELNSNPNKYEDFLTETYSSLFYNRLQEEFHKAPNKINLRNIRKEVGQRIGSNKLKRLINRISKVGRLLNSCPGYTIAFLGADGSGKSSIIENIKPPLNDAFHNAVYFEHMRPNRFPSLARLLGKKEEFNGPVNNPHAISTSGTFGSLLRWGYYLLDYTLGYYLKIYPKKAMRSCVWLFDRYYYDYLIDPKRSRVNLPRWILKVGQLIIPPPDIILCLGADAEIIHHRKPELTLTEVERQVIELNEFCKSNTRAIWIDTGKTIEDSSNDALNAIMGVMGKRFNSVIKSVQD